MATRLPSHDSLSCHERFPPPAGGGGGGGGGGRGVGLLSEDSVYPFLSAPLAAVEICSGGIYPPLPHVL